jgi:hypothetical protein
MSSREKEAVSLRPGVFGYHPRLAPAVATSISPVVRNAAYANVQNYFRSQFGAEIPGSLRDPPPVSDIILTAYRVLSSIDPSVLTPERDFRAQLHSGPKGPSGAANTLIAAIRRFGFPKQLLTPASFSTSSVDNFSRVVLALDFVILARSIQSTHAPRVDPEEGAHASSGDSRLLRPMPRALTERLEQYLDGHDSHVVTFPYMGQYCSLGGADRAVASLYAAQGYPMTIEALQRAISTGVDLSRSEVQSAVMEHFSHEESSLQAATVSQKRRADQLNAAIAELLRRPDPAAVAEQELARARQEWAEQVAATKHTADAGTAASRRRLEAETSAREAHHRQNQLSGQLAELRARVDQMIASEQVKNISELLEMGKRAAEVAEAVSKAKHALDGHRRDLDLQQQAASTARSAAVSAVGELNTFAARLARRCAADLRTKTEHADLDASLRSADSLDDSMSLGVAPSPVVAIAAPELGYAVETSLLLDGPEGLAVKLDIPGTGQTVVLQEPDRWTATLRSHLDAQAAFFSSCVAAMRDAANVGDQRVAAINARTQSLGSAVTERDAAIANLERQLAESRDAALRAREDAERRRQEADEVSARAARGRPSLERQLAAAEAELDAVREAATRAATGADQEAERVKLRVLHDAETTVGFFNRRIEALEKVYEAAAEVSEAYTHHSAQLWYAAK